MKKSLRFIALVVGLSFSTTGLTNTENSQAAHVDVREVKCLAKNIYYEAGSESYEGKLAVAQVTLNRTQHSKFPSTVCGVVYQKTRVANRTVCQFAWACNPRKKINTSLYREAVQVAEQVLINGVRHAKMQHALFFHERRANPAWKRKLQKLADIGNHSFYGFRAST